MELVTTALNDHPTLLRFGLPNVIQYPFSANLKGVVASYLENNTNLYYLDLHGVEEQPIALKRNRVRSRPLSFYAS